ncbi:hypothetical protein EYV94_06625 [Puteibacter caeruleilacunae]|nr:hypothetical protein EYV94_06625 [Puteibacter caeruleilacunae]
MDKSRTELFELGMSLLKDDNALRISLLKTQVYNLRTSADFVIKTESDVKDLVSFLNRYPN